MCTSPILIRNRKFRAINVKLPNSFIKVPCGVCDECLRKRAKDLYVRARFESVKCIRDGGVGFMCTLTYDDNLLPILTYKGKEYMVFNKKHVIDFIKRLRTHLTRFYKKNYDSAAPEFKYLITSEYGTDPTRTHRPHYHCLFLFRKDISLYAFRNCFEQSLVNQSNGKRYFGYIYQCDKLDIKRGGVRYVSKYILKDLMYEGQRNIIRNLIKYEEDKLYQIFRLVEFPSSYDDFFTNKCIRSCKEYKKYVTEHIAPLRHMLQFYMVSNDFGCSAIVEEYGDSLPTLGCLSIDKFPYAIPKSLVLFCERKFGTGYREQLSKSVFMSHFKSASDYCVCKRYMSCEQADFLYEFCNRFIVSRYGALYFTSLDGKDFYERVFEFNPHITDDLLCDFHIYEANDFYELRNVVLSVIDIYNCKEMLDFRAKLAHKRSMQEIPRTDKRTFQKEYHYI